MPIQGFPLRPAYEFASANGLAAEAAQIRAIPSLQGFPYNTGVRRAHMIELLARKGILEKFMDSYWPEGQTEAGKAKMELYARRRLAYETLESVPSEVNDEEDDDDSPEPDSDYDSSSAFAYERDLQNFLASVRSETASFRPR